MINQTGHSCPVRLILQIYEAVGYLAAANALVDNNQSFAAIITLVRIVTFGVLR